MLKLVQKTNHILPLVNALPKFINDLLAAFQGICDNFLSIFVHHPSPYFLKPDAHIRPFTCLR